MATGSLDRPSLPSIRSIPVLAQYLPPSADAESTAYNFSSKVEVIDLTGSEDSEEAAAIAPVLSSGKVESPERIGKKLLSKVCGSCKGQGGRRSKADAKRGLPFLRSPQRPTLMKVHAAVPPPYPSSSQYVGQIVPLPGYPRVSHGVPGAGYFVDAGHQRAFGVENGLALMHHRQDLPFFCALLP
ncbi:hypothetical protein JCM3774_001599 [Rhodotorula dairenensis]